MPEFFWLSKHLISSVCLWSGEDAVQAVKYGVDGIVVSNHGARQLDGVPATVCVCESVMKKKGMYRPFLFLTDQERYCSYKIISNIFLLL